MDVEPGKLTDYDPAWPERYGPERARLREVVGDGVRIEHVGSTAVPGLAAKPAVDVMVVVPDMDAAREAGDALGSELGYEYWHAKEDWHFLVREGPGGQVFALHLFPADSERWRNNLRFREYLRAHPDAAAEYERLKRDLAAEHPDDTGAYSRGKAGFIERTIERARDEGVGPD